jgi:hypothetical protein
VEAFVVIHYLVFEDVQEMIHCLDWETSAGFVQARFG